MTADTTPSPTKGPSLVERLEARARSQSSPQYPLDLIREAASYITELEGERDCLQFLFALAAACAAWTKFDLTRRAEIAVSEVCAERNAAQARAEAAEANARRLEEALRPFAERAEAFEDPSWADTDAVSLLCEDWVVDDRLTVGDLRKARAALEQTKGESA